jgi:multidrug transporter EmrE-like cation transporter
MSLPLIVGLSLAEILGDTFLKFFAREGGAFNWVVGHGAYAIVLYLLVRALKTGNVMYVNGMWDGMSALLETLFAIIVLKETLNTKYQYIGIGFIVIGIYMLHMGGIKK